MEQQRESPMTGDERFRVQKDKVRKRLLKYTRKAFRMLPQMDKPRILDVGCSPGASTLDLARLSRGEIIGLDIGSILCYLNQSSAVVVVMNEKPARKPHNVKINLDTLHEA